MRPWQMRYVERGREGGGGARSLFQGALQGMRLASNEHCISLDVTQLSLSPGSNMSSKSMWQSFHLKPVCLKPSILSLLLFYHSSGAGETQGIRPAAWIRQTHELLPRCGELECCPKCAKVQCCACLLPFFGRARLFVHHGAHANE